MICVIAHFDFSNSLVCWQDKMMHIICSRFTFFDQNFFLVVDGTVQNWCMSPIYICVYIFICIYLYCEKTHFYGSDSRPVCRFVAHIPRATFKCLNNHKSHILIYTMIISHIIITFKRRPRNVCDKTAYRTTITSVEVRLFTI